MTDHCSLDLQQCGNYHFCISFSSGLTYFLLFSTLVIEFRSVGNKVHTPDLHVDEGVYVVLVLFFLVL